MRSAFTLLELVVVIGILGVLAGMILPAIHKGRAAAQRLSCACNLKELGVALQAYHNSQGTFPPGSCIGGPWPAGRHLGYYEPPFGAPPNPYLRYRYGQQFFTFITRILPALGQEAIYNQIDWNAWPFFQGTPGNYLNAVQLRVLQCPADPNASRLWRRGSHAAAASSYVGVNGSNQRAFDGILFVNARIPIDDITDGTSNTLIVGERALSPELLWGWWFAEIGEWPWFSAPDVNLGVKEIDLNNPPQTEYVPHDFYRPGSLDDPLYYNRWHNWSRHGGGSNWLLSDGSVRFITYATGRKVLEALATRAGGEALAGDY
jgi:prepilin-type N-terminal cleavage/methylation domain-containing protein/prepilin-type processing-associated H-X9-DG protein